MPHGRASCHCYEYYSVALNTGEAHRHCWPTVRPAAFDRSNCASRPRRTLPPWWNGAQWMSHRRRCCCPIDTHAREWQWWLPCVGRQGFHAASPSAGKGAECNLEGNGVLSWFYAVPVSSSLTSQCVCIQHLAGLNAPFPRFIVLDFEIAHFEANMIPLELVQRWASGD